MHEHAQLIRGLECGLGRAPRVKTHAVQPVVLVFLQKDQPSCLVHRRIRRPGMDAVVLVAPDKYRAPVQLELLAVSDELAQSERFARFVAIRLAIGFGGATRV